MRRLVTALVLVAALAVTGEVRAESAAAPASIDEDVMRRVGRHNAQLRRCYRQGLRDAPDLGRKLVVRFRVGASGRAQPITFVSHKSTLRHAGVERCIKRVFRGIRFRRLDEPTWFSSPLVFAS